MKKLICLFWVFLLVGCGEINYKEITAEKAKQMIDNNDVLILDVRTKQEFETGHLKNSVNVPVDDITTKINDVVNDKEKTIIIYCKSGTRAKIAAEALIELEYKKVYTFGGINSWKYDIEY